MFLRRKGTTLTAQQVRQHLTDHVKRNELQKGSCVTLDPIMSDVLLNKGERADTLQWDELMTRCLARMGTVHQMTFPSEGGQEEQTVVVKGELECIDISTAKRSGNKKVCLSLDVKKKSLFEPNLSFQVTLITGLETFRIGLEQFAHR